MRDETIVFYTVWGIHVQTLHLNKTKRFAVITTHNPCVFHMKAIVCVLMHSVCMRVCAVGVHVLIVYIKSNNRK